MERKIIEAPQQFLYGQPSVSFRPNDFNAVIWSHGYLKVYIPVKEGILCKGVLSGQNNEQKRINRDSLARF